MKQISRLQSLIELLDTIFDENNRMPADDLFVNYCRNRRYIGSKDRQFLSHSFFYILRFYNSLAHVLKGENSPRMLAFCYWLLQNESFEELEEEESPYGTALPNSHEKKIITKACENFKENPFMIPYWTNDLFNHFGDKKENIIQSLFLEAPFDIRINPLLTDRNYVLKELSKENISAKPTKISPYGIRLTDRVPLQTTHLWKEGFIEIQDEGAQIVSLLCDVKPNHQVLDYCAGAGGKTLLLSALMENKGRVIATDIHKYRLEQGQKRYRRSKVHNIQIKNIEDTKWWKRHHNFFDRVLIDVPCSGSGTWRRNPDLKIRFQKKDLHELLIVQQQILENVKKYVKPDSYLIYATCSLFEAENQKQIELFLKNNTDFESVNIQNQFKNIKNFGLDYNHTLEKGYLQLTPFEHEVDGFFICVLKKRTI